ncbi:hypothetical protein H9Q69_007621 [Fusarium xylarioides]|uniref:Uncharacterized protein n=1 Tax=Fusarium xylarioides TaxID=221167 RepID=A0A9P7IXH3_9HYPO|nr:hypothetical protein H9Q72_012052 [Fusarium xylarioides]KAG5793352.1 hypothetical protein H9Q69_007621 [Fusarium xylarioides]KAG5821461.1 hypothetical protein H9Q71_000226 [Fusarium xylarioides]KAG5829627.1 hypothetical protein H9Q74_000275 [Fusarium xylarioides]
MGLLKRLLFDNQWHTLVSTSGIRGFIHLPCSTVTQNPTPKMVRFFSLKKPVDSKGQACEVVGKEVEESVRALEDFEIELDQTAEDYVEIIDHAAPKRPRAVWKGTKEVGNQGFVVVMKDTEVKAVMKYTKGKAKISEDIVVVEGFKDPRLEEGVLVKNPKHTLHSGNVKK